MRRLNEWISIKSKFFVTFKILLHCLVHHIRVFVTFKILLNCLVHRVKIEALQGCQSLLSGFGLLELQAFNVLPILLLYTVIAWSFIYFNNAILCCTTVLIFFVVLWKIFAVTYFSRVRKTFWILIFNTFSLSYRAWWNFWSSRTRTERLDIF